MLPVRVVRSEDLTSDEKRSIRALMDRAFESRFDDHDWDHALGGLHVVGEIGGGLVAHASVVPRVLAIESRMVPTGYVEAVAVEPASQRGGYGTSVMSTVGDLIREQYGFGALATSSPGFYRRFGWEVWCGPTFMNSPDGLVRTADEDGGVLVLRCEATRGVDLTASIACDWRRGDVW